MCSIYFEKKRRNKSDAQNIFYTRSGCNEKCITKCGNCHINRHYIQVKISVPLSDTVTFFTNKGFLGSSFFYNSAGPLSVR